MKIHPAAECVRLMDAEELSALVASIKTSGLREPIEIGRVNGAKSEMLVNGRNRMKACEIAGVKPQFQTIEFANDDEVKAYVADKSTHRHLNKGQQAMRMALLYPEPEKGGRGHKKKRGETPGFSNRRLYDARTVLAYSHELALAVRDGVKSLDDALKEVAAAREALTTDEGIIAKLRKEAPDLAELVAEERMKAVEALAAFRERERKKAETIESGKHAADIGLSGYLAAVASILMAASVTDEKLLDKKRLASVVKATEQLKSVCK